MPFLHTKLEIERCPHCSVHKPHMGCLGNWGTTSHQGGSQRWWAIYKCENCGGVTLAVADKDGGEITAIYPSGLKETFEYEHLPDEVANDFEEALDCYSISRFNAFGAMCRRTIQSVFSDLGAKGKARVEKQLEDIKETAEIDDDAFDVLKQIIISGHDGAHPHLPKLTRASWGAVRVNERRSTPALRPQSESTRSDKSKKADHCSNQKLR